MHYRQRRLLARYHGEAHIGDMVGANEPKPMPGKWLSWPGLEGAAGVAMLATAAYAAVHGDSSLGQKHWFEWVVPAIGAIVGYIYFRSQDRRYDRANQKSLDTGDER